MQFTTPALMLGMGLGVLPGTGLRMGLWLALGRGLLLGLALREGLGLGLPAAGNGSCQQIINNDVKKVFQRIEKDVPIVALLGISNFNREP